MTDAELPPSLTRLTFHGPLSEARAARLVARLSSNDPRTVLDIGCGWGELMLRVLAAAPDATGLGLDTDEGDLARGLANARDRGVEGATRRNGSPLTPITPRPPRSGSGSTSPARSGCAATTACSARLT